LKLPPGTELYLGLAHRTDGITVAGSPPPRQGDASSTRMRKVP